LSRYAQATSAEFMGKTMFVSRFEQTRPKRAMHFQPGIDDRSRHRFYLFGSFVPFVVQLQNLAAEKLQVELWRHNSPDEPR
jgi:hypothetical protein